MPVRLIVVFGVPVLASIAIAAQAHRSFAAVVCACFFFVSLYATRSNAIWFLTTTKALNAAMLVPSALLAGAMASLLTMYLAITMTVADQQMLFAIKLALGMTILVAVLQAVLLRDWKNARRPRHTAS